MTEPGSVLFGREQLEQAFTALGERLVRRGVVADIFVVGGAANFNFDQVAGAFTVAHDLQGERAADFLKRGGKSAKVGIRSGNGTIPGGAAG